MAIELGIDVKDCTTEEIKAKIRDYVEKNRDELERKYKEKSEKKKSKQPVSMQDAS
jgi:hypothetical protein